MGNAVLGYYISPYNVNLSLYSLIHVSGKVTKRFHFAWG